MALFSDVLITSDFDRTLTDRESNIPERNLEAIRYFMDNGGAFTLNTGRSLPIYQRYMDLTPCNAPVILYNGSAAYDLEKQEFAFCHRIDLDLADTVRTITEMAPEMILELQGGDSHFIFRENPIWHYFNSLVGCKGAYVPVETVTDHFIKLCVYAQLEEPSVGHLFRGTEEQVRRFDALEAALRRHFGDKLTVIRAAARIIDLHAPGISKGKAAVELKQQLGRKILVCVGDEENDVSMLDMADYSFCPCDSPMAQRYETVCSCGEGALADVIYKKIPEILGFQP